MKKKIFKYIKVMMACLLIASLTLPSYAAVSASDGSAFVTKAEFDAALSDFNARLTTFEAGINSKIDSQVSSYLDRNGIWNGKQQVVEDNIRFGARWDWSQFFKTFGASTESMTTYNTRTGTCAIKKSVLFTPKDYVTRGSAENCIILTTKSGLMCLRSSTCFATFPFTDDTSEKNPVYIWLNDIKSCKDEKKNLSDVSWPTGGGYEGLLKANLSKNSVHFPTTISVVMEYKSELDGVVLTKTIACANTSQETSDKALHDSTIAPAYCLQFNCAPFSVVTGYDYFFVSKGSRITCEPVVSCLGNTVLSTSYTGFLGMADLKKSTPSNTWFTIINMVMSSYIY